MRSNWRRGSKCLVDVKFKSPVAKTEMLPDQTKNDVRREEREKPLARAAGDFFNFNTFCKLILNLTLFFFQN